MTSTVTIPGVVTVAPRALEQVVRGLVRDLLGSPVEGTAVQLASGPGGLAVRISTAAPLGGSQPLLPRLHELRGRLAARVEEITGRHVASVALRITGALPTSRRRVE